LFENISAEIKFHEIDPWTGGIGSLLDYVRHSLTPPRVSLTSGELEQILHFGHDNVLVSVLESSVFMDQRRPEITDKT
jgi:hypothetical protein